MRETSSNTREIVTCERLRQLKMSGMADAYEKQLNDPNALHALKNALQKSLNGNGRYDMTKNSIVC